MSKNTKTTITKTTVKWFLKHSNCNSKYEKITTITNVTDDMSSTFIQQTISCFQLK